MLIHQRSWIGCASYVVLALTCLVVTDRGAEAGQTRMKVVLDTDIGTDIDDAWALGYALKSPSFELLGVTVSDADTPQRAKMACKLLHRLGRTDVPVAVGRKTAAVPPDRVDYQFTWAEDFREYAPVAAPASDFLADVIRRHPGEITLIAVGPLQNIGDLVRKHPDVVPLVKRVVLMSGSIGANAYGPAAVAEWNVKLAIPEAQAVYSAAWPLTIVPLDSTSYVRLTDAERTGLRDARHAPHHRARGVVASVGGWAGEPDDAARSAGTRRSATPRAFLRANAGDDVEGR